MDIDKVENYVIENDENIKESLNNIKLKSVLLLNHHAVQVQVEYSIYIDEIIKL